MDITAESFNLPRGTRMIYHTGDLVRDFSRSREVWKVRCLAWEAMLAGKVHLVQRRLGDCKFEYIALGCMEKEDHD